MGIDVLEDRPRFAGLNFFPICVHLRSSAVPLRPELRVSVVNSGSSAALTGGRTMVKPTRRLRELLAAPGLIRSLGAHDVFTALIVERAGFETVFIGGFGASASMLGLPDLNLLTMTEMAEAVRRM